MKLKFYLDIKKRVGPMGGKAMFVCSGFSRSRQEYNVQKRLRLEKAL